MQTSLIASANAATAETQYVTVQGTRIAYRAIGKGKPLILANRMRGTLDTWDPLFLDTLAQGQTVITFDYPGIGYSEGTLPTDMSKLAQFVRDFAKAFGFDKFALGGWSWGGYVTQSLIVETPDIITHAILIATNPPGDTEYPLEQAFLDRALKPVNDMEDDYVLFFDPTSERSKAAGRASRDRIYSRPGVVERIPSTIEEIMQYIGAYQVFKEDKVGRREGLTMCEVPMLVVGGDKDISTAAQNWYPLIGKIPRGHLVVLPETGHGPQHQYPVLAAQHINAFIATV